MGFTRVFCAKLQTSLKMIRGLKFEKQRPISGCDVISYPSRFLGRLFNLFTAARSHVV